MLKITRSSQPIEVKTLVAVIYGPPGLGKTTLAFTTEKPMLLDFDRGSHRAKNRKDVALIEKWSDVTDITAQDLAEFSTVVVDTAGRALDVLAADIIQANPKMGRGGALSLQGYGELKSKFTAWLKLMRSFGKDVVLIAHSDEQRNGDDVIERLDVAGGSKNEIYKSADLMGRISIANNRRIFNCSPTDTAFGKNPGGLPTLDVPHFEGSDFFAKVLSDTKAALNALTAEQAATAALLGEWQEKIAKLEKAADFNAQIEPIKALGDSVRDNVKRILGKASKEKNLQFVDGQFVDPAAPAREPGADDAQAEPTTKARKGSKAA